MTANLQADKFDDLTKISGWYRTNTAVRMESEGGSSYGNVGVETVQRRKCAYGI